MNKHLGTLVWVISTIVYIDFIIHWSMPLTANETMCYNYNSNDTSIESNYDATVFRRENSKVKIRQIIYNRPN